LRETEGYTILDIDIVDGREIRKSWGIYRPGSADTSLSTAAVCAPSIPLAGKKEVKKEVKVEARVFVPRTLAHR